MIKGRHGFYPTSYDIYLKIKYLHKMFWEAVRLKARHGKWARKRPENRVGIEPIFCPLFKGLPENRYYKNLSEFMKIPNLYNKVRMPCLVETDVKGITSDEIAWIEDLHEKVEKWHLDLQNRLNSV